MKRNLVIFFQILITLTGIGVLVLMLWEPHLEGRNAQATLFEIYFNDPFLAYVYIGSVPFFVAVYKAFKVLGYAGQNKFYSKISGKSLAVIKYCAALLIVLIAAAQGYLFLVQRGKEDIAGGVAIGLFLIIVSGLILLTAKILERKVQINENLWQS